MDNLPNEVLLKILLSLPPSDRLNGAVTCHRWSQIVATSQLLEDVWLGIGGSEMNDAKSVLMESNRQYRNLRLSKADLFAFDGEFWSKVGQSLRVLDLQGCRWSPQAFFKILRECSKLESLRISPEHAEQALFTNAFEISEDTSLEEIQRSTRLIRHLHLGFFLTEEVLALLFRLMPNVTSTSFSCFELHDLLGQLPSLLGPDRAITGLDLRDMILNQEHWIELMRISSASLRELKIRDYKLTREAYDAIGTCTKLRLLALEGNSSFGNRHLRTLLLNNPGLETLVLGRCPAHSDVGFAPLRRLKKLQKLDLQVSMCMMTNAFLSSLREIRTLQHLNLSGQRIDVGVLRSLSSLPDLTTLSVDFNHLDRKCIHVIFELFGNLESLDLGYCMKLTDADMANLRNLKLLRSFSFAHGFGLTDQTFGEGLGSPLIEFLTVDASLTDVSLAGIAAHNTRLKKLHIINCKRVTDTGIANLLRCEPRLRQLDLSLSTVTGEFLGALEELCPRLEFIRIDSSSTLNSEAAASFKKRRPEVRAAF